MSAGLASKVFVHTVRGCCLFCARAFFLLGCGNLTYIRYISHGHHVLHHLWHTTHLVIHDVDDSTRLGGEHTDTLRQVKEGYSRQILAHTLRGVLVHLIFEDTLLDPVVKALISKVDVELVEQVGADGGLGDILGAREVEQADEACVVFVAELLVEIQVKRSE